MNKSEFLAILREQLEGEVPSNEIYSNLHYYDEYIDREVSSGKTIEEVMELLGDPRLIAKTIIDADEVSVYGNAYQEEADFSRTDSYAGGYSDGGSANSDPQSSYYQEDEEISPKVHRLDLSTWYGKALLILAAAAVIFLVVTLVSALLPFIVVIVLICVIMALFRKKR